MRDFEMVHPQIFINNPLIKKISEDENWTVSDDKKVPINAKMMLDTGNIKNARFDGESPLVKLTDLDKNNDLKAVNRTYRMKARVNNIMVIDVEPESPDSMKEQVLSFPAHYTELSTNGGVHLLIEVPEDLITDEIRYMFDDLSVFKEPLQKGVNRQAHYEVIFNDHFITFTKKMDTDKRVADFVNNQEDREQLIKFLENIAKQDKDKKKEREIAKKYQLDMVDKLIDENTLENIEKFIGLRPFDSAKTQADEKNIKDFNNDSSRYEMSVVNGLAYHTLRIHNLAKDTISFRETVKDFTEKDLVHAIYLLSRDILPYRAKHDEIRDGLPWLLFTAKRGYEYIKAKQNEKK